MEMTVRWSCSWSERNLKYGKKNGEEIFFVKVALTFFIVIPFTETLRAEAYKHVMQAS
jgi:hypothetical protein